VSNISRTPAGHYRANWREPSGRLRAKTFKTKKEAARFLAELDSSLSRGTYVDPHAGRMPFRVLAQRWLDSRNDEATTKARDASIMRNHVIAKWGDWPLGKIDHLAVQEWITALGERRSPATVAQCHRLTSAVLRSAVRNRLIAFNPCEGVRLPRRRKRDTDEQVISREELRSKLLPAVPARYRALVATAAGTGLRWGEAAGVCIDALDLDRRQLRVIRTIVEVSGQTAFKAYPKSAAGRRRVPLPVWLLPILREHRAMYPAGEQGLVFPNSVGKPLSASGARPSSVPVCWVSTNWSMNTRCARRGSTTAALAMPRSSGPRGRPSDTSRGKRPAGSSFTASVLVCDVARRRWGAGEHGPAGHGPRALVDDARPLHPPDARSRPNPPGTRRRRG
jgi:integrase